MRLLRILPGVFIACLALVCALVFCQGRSSSPEITGLLQRRGPVEIWQKTRMSQTQGSTVSKENPLVVQARIYAKLLNPPKPARTVVRSDRETVGQSDSRTVTPSPHPKIEAIPQKASVHFKVLATSVFAKEPEKSMALVSEPGKGPSWIKPGDMLGYLKVTEIRRDAVVYAFEETTGEVAWEPSQDTARPRTKVESPILAMEMPSAAASQAPLPSVPSPPLPSRLATPVNGRMHAISPRPARGGR